MRIIFFLFVFFISACASFGGSKGTEYNGLSKIKENTGQIYLYRPSRFIMSYAIPTVKINGDQALPVRNGSYVVYDLAPGEYTIFIGDNANWSLSDIEFKVQVEPNKRQFFRLVTSLGSFIPLGSLIYSRLDGHLSKVSSEFAESELSDLLHTGNWP